MSLAGTVRGARFHPVTHNSKLAPVVMEKVPAAQVRKYGKHVFDRRPLAKAPFVSATYTSIQATCSEDCPFKRDEQGKSGGCFADAAFSRGSMKKMDAEASGLDPFEVTIEEVAAIDAAFPRGVPQDGARGGRDLRLHVGGDVATAGGAQLLAMASARWKERGGGEVWTYTHSWRRIPRAAFGGISVLASVETAAQAKEARARGYAPALVVERFPDERHAFISGGLRFVPCPAETTGTTCAQCRPPTNGSNGSHAPRTKGGKYQEPLPCILTDEEQKDRAHKLAAVDKRIDEMDAERREIAQGYGKTLKALREERAPLIEAVETGKETRLVDCQEIPNYERNNWTVRRLDTNEDVRERAMEADERASMAQGELPVAEA